ncbi:MAG: RNA ligase family protein [Ruminococcus flavefaciens]|nr:RNA ligase family protein [Ruminococcus flavefaciens]MCM1228897.1 RNA ligase family protein [Ruminococcus flavefaciens]
MLKHKHYMEIEVLDRGVGDRFHKGDRIIIQEKIDGSNVSFQYDSETDSLQCFSRNQILSAENTLRGYYDWVQKLDKALVKSVLGDRLRMFGEWLVKHAVKYPDECYNTMYCFDVFDTENKCWLQQNEVKSLAEKLGLNYVPVFYEGEFTDWEDYKYLVGKTEMGGEIGEGIVIKKQGSEDVAYTKIVHERFSEIRKKKVRRPSESPEEKQEKKCLEELTATVVTPARVEKILYKLVDEGILPEDFSAKDMKTIYKSLPLAVYQNCVKEVPDVVNQVENFGKYSNSVAIRLAKEIIKKREET